jgi:DNA uptake protein ComE-like DNA-binding protein
MQGRRKGTAKKVSSYRTGVHLFEGMESESNSSKVRVIVRIRPLLPTELPVCAPAAAQPGASAEVIAAAQTAAVKRVLEVKNNNGQPAVLLKEGQVDSFGKESQEQTIFRSAKQFTVKKCSGRSEHQRTNLSCGCFLGVSFDAVYDASFSQSALFEREVLPALGSKVFSGCSSTIFAYGMTSTGKSFTMNGKAESNARIAGGMNPGVGLIPRTVQHLFDEISDRVAVGEADWNTTKVTMSFFELYNEKIYDLLATSSASQNSSSAPNAPSAAAGGNPFLNSSRAMSDSAMRAAAEADPRGPDLPVREDQNGRVFVAGLSEHGISSYSSFASLYSQGLKNRKIAGTKFNATSSRAHTMIRITVETRNLKTAPTKRVVGRVQLLDLAGNEDNRYSGNVGCRSRMIESTKINNSLFVLGKCINALNSGDARIPYRDSKLTRILASSLGGGNYSIMICCISPNLAHVAWTARTLAFASKSRSITNQLERNVSTVPDPAEEERKRVLEEDKKRREKEDLRARLETWKEKNGKATRVPTAPSGTAASKLPHPSAAANISLNPNRLIASGAAAGASAVVSSAAPSAADIDLTKLTALISAKTAKAEQKQQLDPAVLKKLEALASDVHAMKATLAKQQQQNSAAASAATRPASAHQSAGTSAATHRLPTASTSLVPAASAASLVPCVRAAVVPLTPSSSGHLIRSSLDKARVWERAGELARALGEYQEAQRMGPKGTLETKIAEKIAELSKRMAEAPATTKVTGKRNSGERRNEDEKSNKTRKVGEKERNKRKGSSESESEDEEKMSDEEWNPDSDSEFEYNSDPETPLPARRANQAQSRAVRAANRAASSANSSMSESPSSSSPNESSLLSRVRGASASASPIDKQPSSGTANNKRAPLAELTNTPVDSASTDAQPAKKKAGNSKTNTPLAPSSEREAMEVENAQTVAVAPAAKPKKASKKGSAAEALPLPSLLSLSAISGDSSADESSPRPGLSLSHLVAGRDNLLWVLNHGNLKELMDLQTIGKKRAQLIISKRAEMGGYGTIADLKHIGLSDTQVEQFTERNITAAAMWSKRITAAAIGGEEAVAMEC